MYDPVKDGVAKTVESVVYTEVPPPEPLSELVHCFWELKSVTRLPEDFTLHAMPDTCVNLLFDLHNPRVAGSGGALVKLEFAQPGPGGSMVYFTCDDCAVEEARAVAAGGAIVKPKYSIGEHGFVSIVSDTEGNMIGLHSMAG